MSEIVNRVSERMVARGFPGNLLPDNLTAETFDEASGDFTVTLAEEVSITVDGIPVHYATKVSGNIVVGQITNLSGVKAKQTFWVSIAGIAVDGDNLTFSVGYFSKSVPASAFEA